MKYTTETVKEVERRLPNVGECWSHYKQGAPVYLRIDDAKGAKALNYTKKVSNVYSVNLETGDVVFTPTDNTFHIMEPKTPLVFGLANE